MGRTNASPSHALSKSPALLFPHSQGCARTHCRPLRPSLREGRHAVAAADDHVSAEGRHPSAHGWSASPSNAPCRAHDGEADILTARKVGSQSRSDWT